LTSGIDYIFLKYC